MKRRIEIGFYYVIVLHIVSWVYGWVIQEQFTRTSPVYDWADQGFLKGYFVLILWQFAQQALQNWLYYLLSTMTDNISELSRYSGILRGQESFAQAVSFGINSKEWKGGKVPLAINTALLIFAVVPTWMVVRSHAPVEAEPIEEVEISGREDLK